MRKKPTLDPNMYKVSDSLKKHIDENYRLELFIDNPSGPYAMDAIREAVNKGQPIPDELIPWILEACSAWEEKKGNKQRANSKDTDIKWSQAIVEVWKRYMAGSKLNDALEIVASMYSCDTGTLRAKYYSPEGKHCRDAQVENYQTMHTFFLNYPAFEKARFPDREPDHGFPEKAEALEKQFPRLFKQSGY